MIFSARQSAREFARERYSAPGKRTWRLLLSVGQAGVGRRSACDEARLLFFASTTARIVKQRSARTRYCTLGTKLSAHRCFGRGECAPRFSRGIVHHFPFPPLPSWMMTNLRRTGEVYFFSPAEKYSLKRPICSKRLVQLRRRFVTHGDLPR